MLSKPRPLAAANAKYDLLLNIAFGFHKVVWWHYEGLLDDFVNGGLPKINKIGWLLTELFINL